MQSKGNFFKTYSYKLQNKVMMNYFDKFEYIFQFFNNVYLIYWESLNLCYLVFESFCVFPKMFIDVTMNHVGICIFSASS